VRPGTSAGTWRAFGLRGRCGVLGLGFARRGALLGLLCTQIMYEDVRRSLGRTTNLGKEAVEHSELS
jgi:hypothetical protein